jgi:hypothetical protein
MKLLVLGKEGSGKSALVNSLLEFNREDPRAAKESSEGYSATTRVQCYGDYRGGINVELYDTPGLGNDQSAKKILDQVVDVTKGDVDLVLFCVTLSRGMRVDDSYHKLISLLTRTYTERVWSHTIFVLTFVNDPPHKDGSQHHQTIRNVKQQLHRAMLLAGVDSSIANSVPLLTAGYDRGVLPHETEDWNERLFTECRKPGNYSGEGPLLQIPPKHGRAVAVYVGLPTVGGGLAGMGIGAAAYGGIGALVLTPIGVIVGVICGVVIKNRKK